MGRSLSSSSRRTAGAIAGAIGNAIASAVVGAIAGAGSCAVGQACPGETWGFLYDLVGFRIHLGYIY